MGKGNTRYFTIGDGGNREGLAKHWSDSPPEWSAFRQSAYGYSRMDAYNETHLHISWISNDDSNDSSTNLVRNSKM